MDIGYSVSVKLVQGVLSAAEIAGLPKAAVITAVGLSPSVLTNPDGRIAHSQWVALWQELFRLTSDPSIGAQLAEVTQFESFNVTGYAMSHSPTLGKALARLVRYSRLLYEGMTFTLAVDQATAVLTYQTINAALLLPPTSVGWTFANIVLWAERSLGREGVLVRVDFQQAAPKNQATYRRIFKADLSYQEKTNALLFDAAWLDAPLTNADSGLCDLLDRYADSLLTELPSSDQLTQRLQHLLTEELRGREPKLEVIAHRLGYSPRTLQRKLQSEGTSFQDVLDTLRRELAYRYLQDSQLTSTEIAFLLGFSENSAFNRAFRRWTNLSPGAYRKTPMVPVENRERKKLGKG